MVATTPVYGFVYEAPGDKPGVTLTGGPTGVESPILAEQLEAKFVQSDQNIEAAGNKYLARGWHDITPAGGEEITGSTVFSIQSGAFDIVRVKARGILDGVGALAMRINTDAGATLYRSQWYVVDPSTGTINDWNVFDGTSWTIGRWTGIVWNESNIEIKRGDTNNIMTFTGTGLQSNPTGSLRRIFHVAGSLAETRQLSSITMGLAAGAAFVSARVWIEGHKS